MRQCNILPFEGKVSKSGDRYLIYIPRRLKEYAEKFHSHGKVIVIIIRLE